MECLRPHERRLFLSDDRGWHVVYAQTDPHQISISYVTARCLLLGLTLLSLGACQQQREPPPLEPASWRSDPFLDTLQESTFQFFWKTTDRRTGLTPDRYPTRTFCSIAAVGFGLTAYPIG